MPTADHSRQALHLHVIDQLVRPDLDLVTGVQRGPVACALTVYERTVGTPQVADRKATILADHLGVVKGDVGVFEVQLARRIAPDENMRELGQPLHAQIPHLGDRTRAPLDVHTHRIPTQISHPNRIPWHPGVRDLALDLLTAQLRTVGAAQIRNTDLAGCQTQFEMAVGDGRKVEHDVIVRAAPNAYDRFGQGAFFRLAAWPP